MYSEKVDRVVEREIEVGKRTKELKERMQKQREQSDKVQKKYREEKYEDEVW